MELTRIFLTVALKMSNVHLKSHVNVVREGSKVRESLDSEAHVGNCMLHVVDADDVYST